MKLALHGSSAAVHDHVAGRAGDYDLALAALRGAEQVEAFSEVTRANVRELAGLARWLVEPTRREKIRRWTLSWPGTQQPGLSQSRLGMVTPRILHAAAMARAAGLKVETSGLPTCVLGPHAEFAAPVSSRAYAEACRACASRSTCPGVPQSYLEEFGRDLELRALQG